MGAGQGEKIILEKAHKSLVRGALMGFDQASLVVRMGSGPDDFRLLSASCGLVVKKHFRPQECPRSASPSC
jgi:hypothetical protein